MPTTNDEEWRRTDIRPLRLNQIVPFTPDTPTPLGGLRDTPRWVQDTTAGGGDEAGLLIHRDASLAHASLSAEARSRGVIFTDLDSAARQYPDLVMSHFMTEAVPLDASKFAALHGAFWTGGTFLYVPKNVEVSLPLYSLTYLSGVERNSFGHVLIVADEGSAVTFVNEQLSNGAEDAAQAMHAGAVELYLKAGSLVRYVGLQDWGRNLWNFSVERAILERDSVLQWYIGALGSQLTKANMEVALKGPGARAEMVGFLFADGHQHLDHHTYQNHLSGLTGSDLLFKGALRDRARSVYHGLIRIHKAAQRSDAYQVNRNLLLSKQARADSIPGLEIEANDVRCTHGATAGPVEEEHLFYLMSRGLPRHEAERLIVDGFFDEVLQRIPVERVQERLRASVIRKFEA
ncbi:MAG: Fe-S cluster assembly protein SufD [Anaerolineae bacterium]|nr:Fe-S cluster assembly protein SufD [Anaerolineae bacterium]